MADELRLDPQKIVAAGDPPLSELITAAEKLGGHLVVRVVKNPPANDPAETEKGASREPT